MFFSQSILLMIFVNIIMSILSPASLRFLSLRKRQNLRANQESINR